MSHCIEKLALTQDFDWERTVTVHEPPNFICNEETRNEGHPSLLSSNGNTASSQSPSKLECVSQTSQVPVSNADDGKAIEKLINEAVMRVWDCPSIKELLYTCNMQRFIVSCNKLEELKGHICNKEVKGKLCGLPLSFSHVNGKGTILKLALLQQA